MSIVHSSNLGRRQGSLGPRAAITIVAVALIASLQTHGAPWPGEAIFKWRSSERTMPLLAGSFNHRAEALYRCSETCPENPYVREALERGLRQVRVLHEDTPDGVFGKLVILLNQYHHGSGCSHQDLLNEVGPWVVGRGLIT